MTEDRTTIRDLCRRWRFAEAQLQADSIILADEEFNRRMIETHQEHAAIEAQILDTEAKGAEEADEILRVVLDLMNERSLVDGRDNALLRKALKALAWADCDRADVGMQS